MGLSSAESQRHRERSINLHKGGERTLVVNNELGMDIQTLRDPVALGRTSVDLQVTPQTCKSPESLGDEGVSYPGGSLPTIKTSVKTFPLT